MNTCRHCGVPQSTSAPTCLFCGSDWQAWQMVRRGSLGLLVLMALVALLVVLWLP